MLPFYLFIYLFYFIFLTELYYTCSFTINAYQGDPEILRPLVTAKFSILQNPIFGHISDPAE
jgi:hypothetical protein